MNLTKSELKEKFSSIKSRDLGLLYGILLGDGCLCLIKNKYFLISIVGNIHDDYKFFEDILVPTLKHFTGKDHKIKIIPKARKLEIQFSNKNLFNYLHNLGFPIGKKGTNLKIPLHFNKTDMKFIVNGYFATDGCLVRANNHGIVYPRIEFSSISKQLLIQVLKYLRSIGMTGNLYISHKYRYINYQTLYRIQFNGKPNLFKYKKLIGFCNPKHLTKYELFKKNAAGEI